MRHSFIGTTQNLGGVIPSAGVIPTLGTNQIKGLQQCAFVPALHAFCSSFCRGCIFLYAGPVPPAAAKGLEQRRGVGEAVGLRLYSIDYGLLIRLLENNECEVTDVTQLDLSARNIEAFLR